MDERKNLGGNQQGDECKLSRMLYREQHLVNERFSAGAKTSDAARQEGLELCSRSKGFAEAKLLVRQQDAQPKFVPIAYAAAT